MYIFNLKVGALDLARVGELKLAVEAMTAGLMRREDTRTHHADTTKGMLLAMDGKQKDVIDWIEGIR
jgi:hypothetical protein